MIRFENVSILRGGNLVIEDLCAHVPAGSCTAIVGPNGAGKTSLLMALLGHQSHSGEIKLQGRRHGHPQVGYVPQKVDLDRGMPLTVLEFLCMGHQARPLWLGIAPRQRERAMERLLSVEAGSLANKRLGLLSGGEMQRVLLALALDQSPELLVLDEPGAGVDAKGEHLFCELLEKQRKHHGFTQLMVSHDLSTVSHHANHVICLNGKLVAEGSPQEVLNQSTLTTLFGMHMGLVSRQGLAGQISESVADCGADHSHD